jgi:hypothetical protein
MFIWPFNYYSAMSPLPDLFGGVWVVGRTVITCETPGPVYEMLNNLFVKTSVRDLGGFQVNAIRNMNILLTFYTVSR